MTDIGAHLRGGTRGGSASGVFAHLMRTQSRLAVRAVVIFVAGVAITTAAIWAFGEVQHSTVGYARQAIVWYPFSLSITLCVGYFPVYVATGVTRRELARATVLAGAAMAVVYTAVMVTLIQVERVVHHAAGWPHVMHEGLTAGDSSLIGRLVAEYLLLAMAAQLCGLLVGAVYYRFGGWWGTVSLPLTAGPIVGVLAGVDVAMWRIDLGPADGMVLRLAALSAVLAVVAVSYQAVLRGTPVRSAPVL